MMRLVWAASVFFLLFPMCASAVTMDAFLQETMFEGGLVLFFAGLSLLFVPSVISIGIFLMLLGDVLVCGRLFFGSNVTEFLTAFPDVAGGNQDLAGLLEGLPKLSPIIESLSAAELRMDTMLAISALIAAACLIRYIFNWFIMFIATPSSGKSRLKSDTRRSRRKLASFMRKWGLEGSSGTVA